MLYIFCGGGTDCALNGQPSVDRHLLLRREALELALYTFRYVDDVDSVVTFLPPRPAQTATPQQQQDPQQQQQMQQQQEPDSALFFRRDDDRVQQLLDTPIRELLATRQLSLGVPENEAAIVDEYTLPNLFRYQLQQSPDGQSTILLLSPQPPSS